MVRSHQYSLTSVEPGKYSIAEVALAHGEVGAVAHGDGRVRAEEDRLLAPAHLGQPGGGDDQQDERGVAEEGDHLGPAIAVGVEVVGAAVARRAARGSGCA